MGLARISVKRGYFVIMSSHVIFWLTPPSPSSDDVIYEQPLTLRRRAGHPKIGRVWFGYFLTCVLQAIAIKFMFVYGNLWKSICSYLGLRVLQGQRNVPQWRCFASGVSFLQQGCPTSARFGRSSFYVCCYVKYKIYISFQLFNLYNISYALKLMKCQV